MILSLFHLLQLLLPVNRSVDLYESSFKKPYFLVLFYLLFSVIETTAGRLATSYWHYQRRYSRSELDWSRTCRCFFFKKMISTDSSEFKDGYSSKGDNIVLEVVISSLKGGYSLRNEFAPCGSRFIPLRVVPYVEGIKILGSFIIFSKVVSLWRKNGGWNLHLCLVEETWLLLRFQWKSAV